MKVKHIFIDIDGTLTVYPSKREFSTSPMTLLEELVMARRGLSRPEANARIRSCGDTSVQCLSEFLEELEIPRREYFEALCTSLKDNIHIPEDSVRLLKFLKENGFEVYTATTNSPFATWAKLSGSGLATLEGSEYFTGYFPGCAFLDPRGKNDPDYYTKILKAGNFDPAFCLMIGDIPEKDALPALKAGMRYGVNICRTSVAPMVEKGGILHINSFDVLLPLLEKRP